VKLSGPDRDAVRAAFAGEITARVARIDAALAKLKLAESAEARDEQLVELAHNAHNLRGAAATVGLERIADLAGGLEREAEGLRSSGSRADDQLVGAAFRLRIRLERMAARFASSTPRPAAATADHPHDGDAPIVLHIEDNLSNLKLVERILARRPVVRLAEAQTGEAGLELARKLRPALVLLDLRLPDLPGEEVLQRLRADPAMRELRVIVISAEARPAEATRLIDLGADDYLVKPIELEALLDAVDDALDGAHP
jgi:CheY-like chemotaxis protein/HPt (histidine-containing phosphotransfer) domain-containing protein